jgi:hypothetical protein
VKCEKRGLPRDGTLCSRANEFGVFREDATGIARRKRSPAVAASFQLCIIDK